MRHRLSDHRRADGWRARAGALLLTALGPAAALAQAGDPLRAPECLAAQQQLSQQEDRAAAARAARTADPTHALPASRAALHAARRRVGVVCLGAPDAPLPSAPSASDLPAGDLTPTAALPRSRPAPAPVQAGAPRPPLPLSVTGCDANGCWASDGSRLTRVGPNLLGPRGYCTTAGAILNCP